MKKTNRELLDLLKFSGSPSAIGREESKDSLWDAENSSLELERRGYSSLEKGKRPDNSPMYDRSP